MSKYWKQISFWNKIKAVLALFGVGGEITMFATQQGLAWHGVTVGATLISVVITQFIQDANNNGIVDALETKKQARESSKQI